MGRIGIKTATEKTPSKIRFFVLLGTKLFASRRLRSATSIFSRSGWLESWLLSDMKLYLSSLGGHLVVGKVFHLDKDCPKGRRLYKIHPDAAAIYRKAYGIRRICLRCRKQARKLA